MSTHLGTNVVHRSWNETKRRVGPEEVDLHRRGLERAQIENPRLQDVGLASDWIPVGIARINPNVGRRPKVETCRGWASSEIGERIPDHEKRTDRRKSAALLSVRISLGALCKSTHVYLVLTSPSFRCFFPDAVDLGDVVVSILAVFARP